MQDMIESAKRAASNAVERAAWEADKLRRISERQREVELLQRERVTLAEQVVTVVNDLERKGQIPPGPLKTLAERLSSISADISRGAADIDAIRNEQFQPGSVTISVQRKGQASASPDEIPCPTCGRPVRRSSNFCSACGARLR